MQLSAHFTLQELTRSATAERLKIPNMFTADVVDNLQRLCTEVLEPLRAHLGHPITINSGYRCPALNKAVGGVPNSFHLTGRAADIPRYAGAFDFLMLLGKCSEVINEGTWIHVAI